MGKGLWGIGLLLSSLAFAGVEHGSGGNIVQCDESYEVLDFVEARSLYGRTIDLESGDGPMEKVLAALKRLERLDSTRASLYAEWTKNFYVEARPLVDTTLKPVEDYGYVPIPDRCNVKQVILQRRPELAEQGRYLLHNGYWGKMDKVNQAGMILHEIVYRDGLRRGHPDSSRARFLAALIASREIEDYTPERYERAIRTAIFDAWAAPALSPSGHFRLYDIFSDFVGAEDFCRRLAPSSRVADEDAVKNNWTFHGLSTSAIARATFETPALAGVPVMGYSEKKFLELRAPIVVKPYDGQTGSILCYLASPIW